MDIVGTICLLVSERANVPLHTVVEATEFEKIGLDDLMLVEIIMSLEEKFDISYHDDDLGVFTVGELIEVTKKTVG